MAQEWKRTVTSKPGAAITTTRIEIPQSVRDAVSAAIQRGKADARREREERRGPMTKFLLRVACFVIEHDWRQDAPHVQWCSRCGAKREC
jgi:hypothetical protein